MIRTRIAAWLLRRTGATVEYEVRRIDTASKRRVTGRLLLTTPKLKEARAKLQAARRAETDRLVISLNAIVASRDNNPGN